MTSHHRRSTVGAHPQTSRFSLVWRVTLPCRTLRTPMLKQIRQLGSRRAPVLLKLSLNQRKSKWSKWKWLTRKGWISWAWGNWPRRLGSRFKRRCKMRLDSWISLWSWKWCRRKKKRKWKVNSRSSLRSLKWLVNVELLKYLFSL